MSLKPKQIKTNILIFQALLPDNPEGNPWTTTDISRVMLRFSPMRTFDPDNSGHAIDMQWALKGQFYSDIKAEAELKIQQLQQHKIR